jgi:hypothetical protein
MHFRCINDILIYNKASHHLAITLKNLHNNHISVNLSKCIFASQQVEYLGHIITGSGVSIEPTKIFAIFEWLTPENVTQMRGFLGFMWLL